MGRLSQLGKMALHWGDSQMFQKVWRPVLGRVFGLLDGPVHRNNSSSPGQAVVVKGGLTHTNTMDPNKHTWSIWYFLVLDGQCTVFSSSFLKSPEPKSCPRVLDGFGMKYNKFAESRKGDRPCSVNAAFSTSVTYVESASLKK